MSKRSIITLLALFTIAVAVQSQTVGQLPNPLVLITEADHSSIKSIDQLNKAIEQLPNLKAMTLSTDQMEIVAEELRKLGKDFGIDKAKVSSLQVMEDELKNVQGVKFEQVSTVDEIKKVLEQSGKNILLNINWNNKQPRLLSETHEQVIATPSSEEPEQRSQLFANMDSATLTGLLVSLFLIIVLLIAVNCLYEIKTNDQFGRTNLWVGKES